MDETKQTFLFTDIPWTTRTCAAVCAVDIDHAIALLIADQLDDVLEHLFTSDRNTNCAVLVAGLKQQLKAESTPLEFGQVEIIAE